ncbi:PIGR protein, partial [Geococcyx californianus]|nr:PIGR protein [Geococcyx californianus]
PVSSALYGSRFLTGHVGGSVTHQCFYSITPANKHDRKYWCKIVGNRACFTIVSTTGYTSQNYTGRVSLVDIPQNGTFAVTMTELKKNDTGTYRCGIGTTNRDLYVSLNLTILADAVAVEPIEFVRGELRGSVTVLCPPRGALGAEKRFWCKVGTTGCTLIADTDGYVGKSYQGRIFITPRESSGAFKILINELRKEDSGLYRCGTGKLDSWDSSRRVALQVTTASTLPVRPKFLSSTVGHSLSVKCHYDPKGNYEKKYLCRWKEASCELLVDSEGFVHESYKGRIQTASSAQENGTYTVVMSHLRAEDAGWYWCGAKNGHTEHTSSVKLLIQKEACSSQDPETSTLATPALSSRPGTYTAPTQRSTTALTYATGTVTKSTSTLLPTATPGTFVTSPGEISQERSSHEPGLLPVVLPVLILLIVLTITILTLTKMKLQKKTGEERSTRGNLEAASTQAGLAPVKQQPMEETLHPQNVQESRTGSGKWRWVFSGTG